MATTTIAELDRLSKGTGVEQIVATVSAVFERRDFPAKGDKPASSVQKIELTDKTGKIYAKVWGKNDISEYKGKTFVFTAEPYRGEIKAMKVEDDEYNGKVTRVLVINKRVMLDYADEAAMPSKAPTAPTTAAKPAATASPARTAPAASAPANEPATAILDRLSVYWEACYNRALEAKENRSLSAEVVQSMTASLFIEGCRQSLWKDSAFAPASKPTVAPAPREVVRPDEAVQEDVENDDVPF